MVTSQQENDKKNNNALNFSFLFLFSNVLSLLCTDLGNSEVMKHAQFK